MKTVQQQFAENLENNGLFSCFEIAVIDKRTQESAYIIFDIHTTQRAFIAQHEALSERQNKSKKIAFCRVLIDKSFSVDYHLQELFCECCEAINNSEWYELAD